MIRTARWTGKRTPGMTLVELMVALAVFSVLMLGLGTVFQANKRNGVVQREFAYLQENARFALNTIATELRSAGFSGCNPKLNILLDQSPTNSAYDPGLFDFRAAVDGYEYTGTGPGSSLALSATPATAASGWANSAGKDIPPAITNAVAGSDILIMKWAEPASITVQDMNSSSDLISASINLTGPSGIPAGTIVILSDCKGGDVFQNVANKSAATLSRGVSGNKPGNVLPGPTNPLSHPYQQAKTSILTSRIHAYYVAVNSSGRPGLYRVDMSNGSGTSPQEIAHGVENMQLLFGEDTDATQDFIPDRYVTADQITKPERVVSVQIGLLIRSPEQLPRTPPAAGASFNVLGQGGNGVTLQAPAEARLRKSFSMTVSLRNGALCRTPDPNTGGC